MSGECRSGLEQTVAFRTETGWVVATLALPGGRGPFPGVVWSHGYGGHGDCLGGPPLSRALIERGVACLRVDHRGCGRSPASAQGPGVQGWESVIDVLAAVTYLTTRTDVRAEAIGLAGESHGGAVVVHAAALDPRVRAVAACDAFSDGTRWLRSMWESRATPGAWPRLRELGAEAARRQVRGESVPAIPITAILHLDAEGRRAFAARCAADPLVRRMVSALSLPSLALLTPAAVGARLAGRPVRLVHGGSDQLVPVAHAEALQLALPGAELHVLPATGHGVILASAGGVALGLVADWLRRHLASDPRRAQ